ncbi:MAG: hypothetical protein JF616_15395 [Fibrobacteres bacterium]|jgi:hypothetical protein|nr:hypothetical protein [Fibrobacterota bacterium]
MPLYRFPAHPLRSLARNRATAWAAMLGALGLFAASCSDNQVAGTSSGVDNPSLTVSFASSGTAARVTGDLNVYTADQNPAIDPEPLATIKIKNSAFTVLTGDDFRRAQQTAAKRAAAGETVGAEDRTLFNLVLTTQDKNGGIALNLVYDSAARAFTRRDSSVKSVALETKPLIRYQARIAKEPVHGEDCRIYVPGTPYLATLVDSEFAFVDLPQGVLPLRLIGSDGKIYPVPDSLNTADSNRVYHPSITPSGSIDTVPSGDSLPDFQIAAPPAFETFVEGHTYLEAKVIGISATDPRLSVLWKWLPDSTHRADSLAPDLHSADPQPPPLAEILSPTSLRTEVRFHGDGVFRFLVSAKLGSRTRSDSVVVSVRHLPPPEPAVIHPAPAESLHLAKTYNVQWQMQGKGPYTLAVSTTGGERWIVLESHYTSPDSLPIYAWTPSIDLGVSDRCLLRVTDAVDTTLVATTKDFFHLVH